MNTEAFKLSSSLTFDTVVSNLNQLKMQLKYHQGTSFCLDLSAITLCDSAGLALLIEMKRLCQRQRKTFVIEGMPYVIQTLAEFCGVDTLLQGS
jgi:phospholipid transport system transporter-binding protein